MDFGEWLELNRPILHEIYYHVIIPARKKVAPKNVSTVSFKQFCIDAYCGSRMD